MKRSAAILLAVAVACILGAGVAIRLTWHLPFPHALYCAIGTAATDGCDTEPHSGAGQLVAVVLILVLIPLLAAVYALLNGAHVAGKIHAAEERIKDHVEAKFAEHRRITGTGHPDSTDREAS